MARPVKFSTTAKRYSGICRSNSLPRGTTRSSWNGNHCRGRWKFPLKPRTELSWAYATASCAWKACSFIRNPFLPAQGFAYSKTFWKFEIEDEHAGYRKERSVDPYNLFVQFCSCRRALAGPHKSFSQASRAES